MEYNSPEFRKWLDKLQQESWQLELIISGFAIYGLISALDPMIKASLMAQQNTANLNVEAILWSIALIAVLILILNLIVHVTLRGLWIGAIGLRYVSGDIDFNKLNYSEKFTSYLKKKVGSFDKYIASLENYCSIIFALSFLLIFYVLAFFLVLFFLGGIMWLIRETGILPENTARTIARIIGGIFGFCAFIIFIDFLGQGFLKRKNWTSKIYFPIYRVFNIITLSFLYRPLAYNFLDNKFAKKISMLILPFYLVLIFITSISDTESNYLSAIEPSSKYYSNTSNYDDMLTEETFVSIASIPSKVVHTTYLKVFLLYTTQMEDFIFEKNESLKPKKDIRGWISNMIVFAEEEDEVESEKIMKNYFETIDELYTIKIDSITYSEEFTLTTNDKERLGFELYIKLLNLKEGKHLLTIQGPIKEDKYAKNSKTNIETLVTIPFWYFPENSNNSVIKVDSLTNK